MSILKNLDKALVDSKDDLLNRGSFVRTLADTLITPRLDRSRQKILGHQATGLVIGVTGPWGSGKSSVLNLTAAYLSKKKNVVAVVFNPWIYEGRNSLLDSFFAEVNSALEKSFWEHMSDISTEVEGYYGVLSFAAKGGESRGFFELYFH